MESDPTKKQVKPRGFASLSKDQLRVVSASGGRRAHAIGNAHRFTTEEAREAALRRHGLPPKSAANGDADKAAAPEPAADAKSKEKAH